MYPIRGISNHMWLYDSFDEIDMKVNKALHKAKRSISYRKNGSLTKRSIINASGQEAIEADIIAEQTFLKTLIDEGLSGVLYSEETGVNRFGRPEEGDPHSIDLLLDPLDGSQNFIKGLPFGCISVAYGNYDPEPRLGNLDRASIMNLYADEVYFAHKDQGAYFNGTELVHSANLDLDPFHQRNIQISYYGYGANASKYYFEFQDQYSLRSLGSAAWELAMVAESRNDAFADIRGVLKTHDFAAARVIINEVGGQTIFPHLSEQDVNNLPLNDFKAGYSIIASSDNNLLNFLMSEFEKRGLLTQA